MTSFNIEAEEILDELLEPNTDDETPGGSIRNYRTLVLHDSEFQERQERALTKLNNLMIKERIEELRQFSDNYGYTDWISDRIAELNSQLIGDKNE